MVTLRDIARELNVSIPQVSKVLNNSRSTVGVSARTAERIREAAARLGYRRNRTAAALRTGRQNTIGVLVHPWGAEGSGLTELLLRGISEEAGARDQQLELRFYETDEQFARGLARVDAAAVDGLIVAGVRHEEHLAQLEALAASDVPVVTVHLWEIPGLPNVHCDEPAIGRVATEHLIARGCKSIAHIHLLDRRLQGYREALEEANLPYRPELVVGGADRIGVTFQDGARVARELLAEGVEFDGLIAQADFLAMGAMIALIASGRKVPDDLKVIGMDDSPICLCGPVCMSSVSLCVAQRARRAVQMLLDAVDHKPVRSEALEPVLCARDSTGARLG